MSVPLGLGHAPGFLSGAYSFGKAGANFSGKCGSIREGGKSGGAITRAAAACGDWSTGMVDYKVEGITEVEIADEPSSVRLEFAAGREPVVLTIDWRLASQRIDRLGIVNRERR